MILLQELEETDRQWTDGVLTDRRVGRNSYLDVLVYFYLNIGSNARLSLIYRLIMLYHSKFVRTCGSGDSKTAKVKVQ